VERTNADLSESERFKSCIANPHDLQICTVRFTNAEPNNIREPTLQAAERPDGQW